MEKNQNNPKTNRGFRDQTTRFEMLKKSKKLFPRPTLEIQISRVLLKECRWSPRGGGFAPPPWGILAFSRNREIRISSDGLGKVFFCWFFWILLQKQKPRFFRKQYPLPLRSVPWKCGQYVKMGARGTQTTTKTGTEKQWTIRGKQRMRAVQPLQAK